MTLYCLLTHRGGLELHCFCSRIAAALGRIRCRKWPMLICLDSARSGAFRLELADTEARNARKTVTRQLCGAGSLLAHGHYHELHPHGPKLLKPAPGTLPGGS
jgi:hypothetical protein